MADAVLLKIKSLMPNLSAKEQKIGRFILDDPRAASRMTISEMSSTLDIADSTVFKFTRSLGYNGFRDFRNNLLSEEFDPEISIHENVRPNDSSLDIAKKVFHSSATSLSDTLAMIREDDLEKALQFLTSARIVSFYGCGESAVVALDAYQKFLRSPISCHFIMDSHMQLMHASLTQPEDCAFVVTHTGVTKEMLSIARMVKSAGGKVIVITSYPNAKISEYADVTFVSTSEETGYRSESLPAARHHRLALHHVDVSQPQCFRILEPNPHDHQHHQRGPLKARGKGQGLKQRAKALLSHFAYTRPRRYFLLI